MNLYEIDAAIMACIDAETGEVVDEAKLAELQLERDKKIEGVACWIKNLKAEVEGLKAEKQAFAERQKAAENKLEQLKNWLAYTLDGNAFKTTKVSVSFRHTQSVEVTDLRALVAYDDTLVKFAEPTPDKTAIKKRLSSGENVLGAALTENVSAIIK